MTAEVKDELSRVVAASISARRAEVATVLRFGGDLRYVGGQVAIDVELDAAQSVAHLRHEIISLYGHGIEAHTQSVPGQRYELQVVRGGDTLARQTGLLDSRGRPVRGLPARVVSGNSADLEAIWRGAVVARGSLSGVGRLPVLEVRCPGSEAALALVGAARRLGVRCAKASELRGRHRVVVRDGEAIGTLLERMGAQDTRMVWEARRARRVALAGDCRSPNFDDANLRRSTQAAETAAARVERALEILGDEVPEHLLAAGRLRVQYRQASLEELGRLADPALTKDTIAGRIRRLLAVADCKASRQGVADTRIVQLSAWR